MVRSSWTSAVRKSPSYTPAASRTAVGSVIWYFLRTLIVSVISALLSEFPTFRYYHTMSGTGCKAPDAVLKCAYDG
jgi:hypothetical protein